MPSIVEDVRIIAAPPERSADALRLVLVDLRDDIRERYIATLLADHPSLALPGLIIALRGDTLIGAVWGNAQPGRVITLWPPRLIHDESDDVAAALLKAADGYASQSHAAMLQSLVTIGRVADERRLRAAKYEHLTDLMYLFVATDTAAAGVTMPARIELVPVAQVGQAALAAIVEKTYEQSLDCPQLNGVRSAAEALASHQAVGDFGQRDWFLVRHHGQDVGCLLLGVHVEDQSCEVVYMGLAPLGRGRHWGFELVRFAQRTAALRGMRRLVLSVDAANTPAVRTYLDAGMVIWEQRQVFWRRLFVEN